MCAKTGQKVSHCQTTVQTTVLLTLIVQSSLRLSILIDSGITKSRSFTRAKSISYWNTQMFGSLRIILEHSSDREWVELWVSYEAANAFMQY